MSMVKADWIESVKYLRRIIENDSNNNINGKQHFSYFHVTTHITIIGLSNRVQNHRIEFETRWNEST